MRDALRWQMTDDTGFEKKGRRSAPVHRHREEDHPLPFASYANPGDQRVLIDRQLYLPRSWFAGPDRLADG
ncbi:hypothetical protein ACRB68_31460 [Actinomadura sp. RB68]|uniref:Transposase n=1 Tax=Actinomadura macrotermitis TaxID=2585200 RepID=A0A7K0BW08_9ACTN|nr:hypothetical protein [Actinomadura macrotermitis]